MKRITKVINWIAEKRILDGYIGIMGVVLWYKIVAKYHLNIVIFELSMRAFKPMLFTIALNYNTWNYHKSPHAFYPPFDFKLIIGPWRLIDTAADAARKTSERVDQILAESRERKAEEDRLISAAKSAGL